MENVNYWPYDEVALKRGLAAGQIEIDSPWLASNIQLTSEHTPRGEALAKKFEDDSLGPSDLVDINWFFSSLSDLPLSYILPRGEWSGEFEKFEQQDDSFQGLSSLEFLKKALENSEHSESIEWIAKHPLIKGNWGWDVDASCQFAATPQGIDPYAFFSIARRFHLLFSVETNKTSELYEYVKTLKGNDSKYKKACALMVRQNHYVTQLCDPALRPALKTAQGSREAVEHFIDEEYGHDRILNVAMNSMDQKAIDTPVVESIRVLMDLLKFSAERNFLGFAMAIDFFERSNYTESDPLAQVLEEGGLKKAADQIDKHKDINDEGGHENVALSFLERMGPISREYAEEAMNIAELLTHSMNLVSTNCHQHLLNSDYLTK